MSRVSLQLDRSQILAFRRRVSHLDQRLPRGAASLRQSAWAGLTDSMPRAAVLSIHARVEGVRHDTWEDPALVQVWGPRFSAYVVPAEDHWAFTVGRWPDDPKRLQLADDLANRLEGLLAGSSMSYSDAGRALGINPNALRYATTTGRLLIRWDGARRPTVWTVPTPDIEPAEAREELARRYLHVFGPGTFQGFGDWAGIKPKRALSILEGMRDSLTPVRTPIGDGWILTEDESEFGAGPGGEAPARFLPSGDTYFLLQGLDRELLVADADTRSRLWTPRVWPGALLVSGEIVGTWRRSEHRVRVQTWRRLSPQERDDVEAEAVSMPLPDLRSEVTVTWDP